jgi:phosphocarrier protein FPr
VAFGMIGIVIVSHSAQLAAGVVELADQVSQGKVRVVAAGGSGDAEQPIGTDAFRVQQAIEAVFSDAGVLVLMDLGSAVLSAETALEFLDEARRSCIRLCAGPLVEGAVAAVSLAAAGGSLAEVAQEAERALQGKRMQLGIAEPAAAEADTRGEEKTVVLRNQLGLHARPAARLIRLARQFDAHVTVENVTAGAGPCDAASLNGLLGLRARQGHQLRFRAQGEQAREVLSALADFVEAGCGDTTATSIARRVETPQERLGGIGASAGIAMGPLVKLRAEVIDVVRRHAEDPQAEWRRLESALRAAREEIRALYNWALQHAGEDEAGIFDAQALVLEDPELMDRVRSRILNQRDDAAFAWHSAAEEFIGKLRAIDDPYLKARAADLIDVAMRVLARLSGASEPAPRFNQPSIIAAHDLLPSQVEKLDPAIVLGVCLETGSASAHSAILARARGIPTVVGAGAALMTVPEGTVVALDGESGKLWVSPTGEEQRNIEERRRKWLRARDAAQRGRLDAASTRDGRRITVLANLSREAEAVDALGYGAEGVGVLRTEFLFLNRKSAPGEDEQFAAYRNIAAALGNRTLVIRTLDIGGDKGVGYVDVGEEENPFLGWRGIRLTLGCSEMFATQIRAILRAGAEHPVEILLPMISTLEELRETKALVRTVEEELRRKGVPHRTDMPIGVMIEVPAAAVIAQELAREASRLSIGTNDLVQYMMAADRTNTRVARIADPFQPAVLRTIRDVVETGRKSGVKVDVCGEMAADPLATPLLLGLGVEEFSVSPPLIPELKRAIARWTTPEAEALARAVLQVESSDGVREMLRRANPVA